MLEEIEQLRTENKRLKKELESSKDKCKARPLVQEEL